MVSHTTSSAGKEFFLGVLIIQQNSRSEGRGSAGALVTVDVLIKQTKPLFTDRVIRARGSAKSWFQKLPHGTINSFGDQSRFFVANFMSCRIRQKNASYLFTIYQRETEGLKDYVKWFNQAILEIDDPSDKVVIMAMMEGFCPEELTEAKQRRRGKYDHKRKELDTRRSDYRDEVRNKRSDRDSKQTNERRPCTPPRCSELICLPFNALIAQVIHGGFGSGGCSSSSRKRHARNAHGRVKEEVYNLSSLVIDAHLPITFNNNDLRGLDKLHPFHTALVGFGGNTTHPLGWIKLPVTLGTEPHQTTVWQDFILVDCPSPYNAILSRPTLGGTKAITSTYHLKMKFPTSTGVGEIADAEMEPLRDKVE
ncbi:hydroxypyruvate reductase [Actinidia rufa]|uniref:Hydroxypyruvate reductase n=1 Tax=Actinidia rufa TaxID=165716 RepID=A0A7J0EMZ5_9ERIC|nr:hydroxypyruvate reductase [Actinidia rufa]